MKAHAQYSPQDSNRGVKKNITRWWRDAVNSVAIWIRRTLPAVHRTGETHCLCFHLLRSRDITVPLILSRDLAVCFEAKGGVTSRMGIVHTMSTTAVLGL